MFASGAKSFLIRRTSLSCAWGNEAKCPAALLNKLSWSCLFPCADSPTAGTTELLLTGIIPKKWIPSNSGPFCDKRPMTLQPEEPTCPFPFSWLLLSSLGVLGYGIYEQNKKFFFSFSLTHFPKGRLVAP